MWFKIKSFLAFLIKSTNQHGVHSPFIFSLVTQCFYSKTNPQKKELVNRIRHWLYHNNKAIQIQDFGKGSKVFKSNRRKVSAIAKVAGISRKKSLLLIRLIEYFSFNTILEIGTSVGLGTSCMSIGNPKALITTLEGCKNTAHEATLVFKKFNLNNIKCVVGEFNGTLPKVLTHSFDLIYFDGNHQKKETLNYFNQCLPFFHNNSVAIFDDINWSKEMQETWSEIKNFPEVTITIDTYFWGIVFFRKEQVKQHFVIRL
ncbi:O-methyltransferase [Lutibacter sp.]